MISRTGAVWCKVQHLVGSFSFSKVISVGEWVFNKSFTKSFSQTAFLWTKWSTEQYSFRPKRSANSFHPDQMWNDNLTSFLLDQNDQLDNFNLGQITSWRLHSGQNEQVMIVFNKWSAKQLAYLFVCLSVQMISWTDGGFDEMFSFWFQQNFVWQDGQLFILNFAEKFTRAAFGLIKWLAKQLSVLWPLSLHLYLLFIAFTFYWRTVC